MLTSRFSMVTKSVGDITILSFACETNYYCFFTPIISPYLEAQNFSATVKVPQIYLVEFWNSFNSWEKSGVEFVQDEIKSLKHIIELAQIYYDENNIGRKYRFRISINGVVKYTSRRDYKAKFLNYKGSWEAYYSLTDKIRAF